MSDLKKNVKLNYKIISIILVICLVSMYFIYQAVQISKADIETQPALKETIYSTIDTKGFVIRDEQFILDNASGTTVSFAQNGERVATGDTVTVVFNSAQDASSYLKINELEKSIKHYEELAGQANFQAVNINSLNTKIENELVDFLESVDENDYKDAVSSVESFRDSLTSKQIAIGDPLDFSKQLTTLRNELVELNKNKYSYTEIKSTTAGYFINGADGYEKTVDYSKIDELDALSVENALESQPQAVPENVVGRVVESFDWYIACVVPTDKTVNLTQNNSLYVNIPYRGIERLPVKLYKIGDRDSNSTMLILHCNFMNEALADLRVEEIQIVTEEYEGYKINNSAIRTVDGVKGVYIVRGNLLGFRKIHIVYSTDKYSIVDNPEGETDYIKQYDQVVTKGVELYDNKLI